MRVNEKLLTHDEFQAVLRAIVKEEGLFNLAARVQISHETIKNNCYRPEHRGHIGHSIATAVGYRRVVRYEKV